MKPHKHAELIKAWADGAIIESRIKGLNGWSYWTLDEYPCWRPDNEYRIKSEPKPDVKKHFMLEGHPLAGLRFSDVSNVPVAEGTQLIIVAFDGETGKIKSAEVLK